MQPNRGMVLLEVVLAIALFAVSAAVLLGALNSSIRTVDRVRHDAIAADLLVTTQSMLQMGLIETVDAGPESFESGPEGWTWQVITESIQADPDAPAMQRVEVVITHEPSGVERRLARLEPAPTEEGDFE